MTRAVVIVARAGRERTRDYVLYMFVMFGMLLLELLMLGK